MGKTQESGNSQTRDNFSPKVSLYIFSLSSDLYNSETFMNGHSLLGNNHLYIITNFIILESAVFSIDSEMLLLNHSKNRTVLLLCPKLLTVFDLITAHTPISPQSSNSVDQIRGSVLFVYFFIMAYVVGTHLNCINLSMQFK